MKLHLPKALRQAIVLCMAMIASQTQAAYIWSGDTKGVKTSDDWKTEANWSTTDGSTWQSNGTGPGTPASNMWDTIALTDVTFGSESERGILLEGWAPKYSLNNAKLYAEAVKFQTNNQGVISLSNGSVLDLKMRNGSFQGTSSVDIGSNSSLIFRNMNQTNSTATLNVTMNGEGAYMKFLAAENTDINYSGAITINAYTAEIDSSISWGKFELGLQTQGVDISSLTVNLGEGWEAIDIEINEENYKGYSNCYYVEQDSEGKYWVVYANTDMNPVLLEWQGGELSWSSQTLFAENKEFADYAHISFTTQDAEVSLSESINVTSVTIDADIVVNLTGSGNQLLSTEGINVKGTLQLNDNALTDDTELTFEESGKLVIGGEVNLGNRLGDLTASIHIADGGSLSISATSETNTFSSTAGTNAEIVLSGNYVIKNQFSQYAGDIVVLNGSVVYIGNGSTENAGGSSDFNVGKVIVQNGGVVWTHTAQETITSAWDLMSGAILGNKDKNKELSGNIRFNIKDPAAETPEYNTDGTVILKQYWNKNVKLSGLLSGDGNVELHNASVEAEPVYIISGADNTFCGHYILKDGDGKGDTKKVTLQLANETAAQYASIDLNNEVCTSYLKLAQDATIKALSSIAQKNTISTAASAATLTVTNGSSGFVGTIGSNVTLNLTGGVFNIINTIINNGTINIDGAELAVDTSSWTPATSEKSLSINGTDGYELSRDTYCLIQGGTVTGLGAILGEGTLSTQDGNVMLTLDNLGSVYHVATADVIAGGDSPTDNTSRATGFNIATDRTVTIAGSTESASVADLLMNSTGNGYIALNASARLKDDDAVQFEGHLIINTGADLRLGIEGESSEHAAAHDIDISRLSGITLAGGTLSTRAYGGGLGDISVTADSRLYAVDIASGQTLSIGNLSINTGVQLDIDTKWKGNIVVDQLTGAGNIEFGAESEDSANRQLTFNSVSGFTGNLVIADKSGNEAIVTMTVNKDESLNASQITASEHSQVIIDGAGLYNLGNQTYIAGYTPAASDAVPTPSTIEKGKLAGTWTGTVSMSGAELDAADLSVYGNGNSTIRFENVTGSLAEQTVASNIEFISSTKASLDWTSDTAANITFSGDISGDGNIAFASGTGNQISFTGNLDEWTGVIWGSSAGGTNIVYSGDAAVINHQVRSGVNQVAGVTNVTYRNAGGMVVNGDINTDAWAKGVVNLKVLNEENATGSVVFKGAISNHDNSGHTNVTVMEGASAEFTNASVKVHDLLLEAQAGVSFTAVEALSINNLTVGEAGTLSVSKDGAVGSIVASGEVSLTSGATINAGLTLNSGATLDMAGMAGGAGVELNGALTFGGQLVLGDNLAAILADMQSWTKPELTLFTGVTSFVFEGKEVEEGAQVQAGTYFTETAGNTEVYVAYKKIDNVGCLVILSVPEPTTATLSLLALAGLAARRRRR